MELDVRGSTKLDGVGQYIPTKKGQDYEVTFKMRARTAKNVATPDEAVHLLWNGIDAKAIGFTADKGGVWTTVKAIVTGTGDKDQLLFRESSEKKASDGTGPFIDEVIVVPTVATTKDAPVDDQGSDPDNCGVVHNMVENCSFEQTDVPDKTWLLYNDDDVPGWKSLQGEKLELWGKDFLGVVAPDGHIIHELDAHRSGDKTDGVYQTIQTEKDRIYSVTFSIRARGNNPDTDDEAIVLEFNGKCRFAAERGTQALQSSVYTFCASPLGI